MRPFLLLLLLLSSSLRAQAQLTDPHDFNYIYDYRFAHKMRTLDADSDGYQDVLIATRESAGSFRLYRNLDGTGQFEALSPFGMTKPVNEVSFLHFELGDMDRDGDQDVVSSDIARDTHPYYANNGDGTFDPGNTNPLYGWDGSDDFTVADLNSDGWNDIIFHQESNGSFSINWNQQDGTFLGEFISLDFSQSISTIHSLVTTDYDLDGDDDILVYAGATNWKQVYLLEQTCPTCYTPELLIDTYLPGRYFNYDDLLIGDFNRDAYPDIAIRHNGLSVFLHEGAAGGYVRAAELTYSNVDYYLTADIGDLNGDGWLDIMAYVDDVYTYQVWFNTGQDSLAFTSELLPTNSFLTENLKLADLNNDNRLDYVAWESANDYSGVKAFFQQAAPLSFALQEFPSNLLFISPDLAAIDWDLDGDPDIVGVGGESEAYHTIFWIVNRDGAGNFGGIRSLYTSDYPLEAIHFQDLNGDGHVDFYGWSKREDAQGEPLYLPSYALYQPDTAAFAFQALDELAQTSPRYLRTLNASADATVDLLLAESAGTFTLIDLDVQGDYTVVADFFLGPSDTPPVAVAYPDLNTDGQTDLVWLGSDSLYWTLQSPTDGSWGRWRTVATGGMPGVEADLPIGDFDGDGDQDIAYQLGMPNGTHSWVLHTFAADTDSLQAPVVTASNSIYNGSNVDVMNLNRDGACDLTIPTNFGENPGGFVISQPGTGQQFAPFLPTVADVHYDPPWIRDHFVSPTSLTADVDGDGTQELITSGDFLVIYWQELDFIPSLVVNGRVVLDSVEQCTYDAADPPLANWRVLVQADEHEQILFTDSTGYYEGLIPDAASNVMLTLVANSDFVAVCPDTIQFLAPFDTTLTANFGVQPLIDCPLLDLSVSATPFRQCFPTTVSMYYQNVGTLNAENAELVLTFDERFTPTSSNFPWVSSTPGSLTFTLATVPVGTNGIIRVDFEPACDQLLFGELVCFEATITPDDLCEDAISDWSGAQLQGSSECRGDTLLFRIQNVGNGPMEEAETYEISIVNDDIVLLEQDDTQLGIGEIELLEVMTDSQTIRLEVMQPDGHPFPEPIFLQVPGCAGAVDDFPRQFLSTPNHEGNPFIAAVCGPIIGPYDPNYKAAVPQGEGPEHFIEKEWPIDYTIHFQNIGSDVARTVVLRDTLSPLLDLTTFKAGAGSHDFVWNIVGDRELIVTFPDINLPDSTANEPASHGFFSYQIQPRADIEPLAAIENRAGIYFDFNPPIITNTTLHTIRKPQVRKLLRSRLCSGDTYLGQTIWQDTTLTELSWSPARDSLTVHQLSVVDDVPTDVAISLVNTNEWEGITILNDTLIIRRIPTELGCDSTVRYQVELLTDIDAPDWAQVVQLGPNPTPNRLRVSWPAEARIHSLNLYKFEGQVVATYPVSPSQQQMVLNLDKQFPAGTYLLQLNGLAGRARYVIQKAKP